MKILLIGAAQKKWRTEYLIYQAFIRAGHSVFWFNDRRMQQLLGPLCDVALKGMVRLIDPDFVLMTRGQGISVTTFGGICKGRKSAVWYFDAPRRFPEDLIAKACEADVLFITNRGHRDFYLERGVKKVLFLPQACDDISFTPLLSPQEPSYGVSFIGNMTNSEYRTQFLSQLAQTEDLHVWGLSNPESAPMNIHPVRVFNRDLANVIVKSFAVLGLNSYEELNTIDSYASNRVWLSLGFGGFFVGYRAPGFDRIVPEGTCCEYFSNIEELRDKLQYYRTYPQKRETIRLAGYSWVRANHTYVHRIKNVLGHQEFE